LIEIADKEAEITEQLSLINMHDLIDWHMYEFKQEMVPLLHELSQLTDRNPFQNKLNYEYEKEVEKHVSQSELESQREAVRTGS